MSDQSCTRNFKLPSALGTREGWADFLDAQRTAEPHLHQIEPTNHCPYTCVMCPRAAKMKRPLGFMEMDLFRKVIDEFAGYGEPVRSKEVELFHFGESLLHPRFPEMVAYASGKGLRTQISTKAFLIRPKLADLILEGRPGRLIVSLDGYDAESSRRICGPNADFDVAVRNIEHLIRVHEESRSSTRLEMRIIRIRENQDRVEEFRRSWAARGIPVEVRTFFPWGEPDLAGLGHFDRYPPNMPCPFPFQYLVVQWNGDVVACCRDYNAANRVGSVLTQTLKEIWEGPECARIRRELRTGDYGTNEICRQCMSIYFTPGDSGAAAADADPLVAVWRRAAENHAERPYLLDDSDGSRFSYADADRLVRALTSRMRRAGVGPGERIVLWSAMHVEAVLAFWAALHAGAVAVPLDPELPAAQAAEILARVTPRLAFVDAQRLGAVRSAGVEAILLDSCEPTPAGGTVVSEWIDEEDLAAPALAPATERSDEPAAIIFTSGTTGRQKGVVLSRRALAGSGRLMAETYAWTVRDVLLSTGNLHTMSGLRNPCVAAAVAGSAVIVPGPEVRSGPLALAEAVIRRRPTLLTTVPAALRALVAAAPRCEPGALASLRAVLSTADRLAEELRAEFQKAFGVTVYNYFGLTETAGLCAGEVPGRGCLGRETIGHPVGAELRLVGEDGRDSPPGEPGELWVKSPHLMLGYYGDEEASSAVFSDGWYRTGDLARPNPDGSYSLVGRIRQIIKNAQGEIVAPPEIEDALMKHPEVADAGACVAPDRSCSGQIVAFVVPRTTLAGPEERERWLTGLRRHLLAAVGAKRSPARIEVRSRLPRNSNGKLRVEEVLRGEV